MNSRSSIAWYVTRSRDLLSCLNKLAEQKQSLMTIPLQITSHGTTLKSMVCNQCFGIIDSAAVNLERRGIRVVVIQQGVGWMLSVELSREEGLCGE